MVFYQSRGEKGLDSIEPFSPTLYASLRLRGSINGKRILCRFNPKIGRFSCILIIIAINRAIMDHQTGAAGQRPQKLTAKIERMGRWVEVSWRNTGIRLETGPSSSSQLLSAAPDPPGLCSSPNGFVVRSSALSQLAFSPSLHSEKPSAAPFLGHPSCPQAAANLEPVLMGELGG